MKKITKKEFEGFNKKVVKTLPDLLMELNVDEAVTLEEKEWTKKYALAVIFSNTCFYGRKYQTKKIVGGWAVLRVK